MTSTFATRAAKATPKAEAAAGSFDAIVIGSGIGGLTVAALLSKKFQKKVLVLEQHFTAGGFTHTFQRKHNYHWDIGLHYVGDMREGDRARVVFDYLTDGKLKWQKMPEVFEKFVYPDFTFKVPSSPERYQADLIDQFPQEEKAIERYFQDVQRAAALFKAHAMLDILPAPVASLLRQGFRLFGTIARETTQSYLDRQFKNEQLKALLASQWLDYGLPPSQACFGIHSIIVTHYFHGGWYPIGGSKAIADSIIPQIENAGGAVITQRRVSEILMEAGKVVGVVAQHSARAGDAPETFHAPVVVSDAGAFNTYMKLIPASQPLPERQQIAAFPKGSSLMSLYLGLKDSPRSLGFEGENHWIYRSYDHNAMAQDPPMDEDQCCRFGYLSFPSLKDPQAKGHTAEVLVVVDYDHFKAWKEKPWRRRGEEYQQLKERIIASLLQLVEHHYPGFSDLVDYAELSTPLSIEHFDASDRGVVYGIPCIPERMEQRWIGSRTPIPNLYLTGTDALSLGIMGAMMAGVKTAGILTGPLGFIRIMATMIKSSKQRQRAEAAMLGESLSPGSLSANT